MNLPLRWDRAERRRRHGGTVEAEHNAVGVKSPHAGIHHAGPHVRYMDVQSPFGSRAAGVIQVPVYASLTGPVFAVSDLGQSGEAAHKSLLSHDYSATEG